MDEVEQDLRGLKPAFVTVEVTHLKSIDQAAPLTPCCRWWASSWWWRCPSSPATAGGYVAIGSRGYL